VNARDQAEELADDDAPAEETRGCGGLGGPAAAGSGEMVSASNVMTASAAALICAGALYLFCMHVVRLPTEARQLLDVTWATRQPPGMLDPDEEVDGAGGRDRWLRAERISQGTLLAEPGPMPPGEPESTSPDGTNWYPVGRAPDWSDLTWPYKRSESPASDYSDIEDMLIKDLSMIKDSESGKGASR
jgi:hypothetical protein